MIAALYVGLNVVEAKLHVAVYTFVSRVKETAEFVFLYGEVLLCFSFSPSPYYPGDVSFRHATSKSRVARQAQLPC